MIGHNSHTLCANIKKTWWVGSQHDWESAYQNTLSSTYRGRYKCCHCQYLECDVDKVKLAVAYLSLTIIVYILRIYGELEGPRDTKLGTLSINDVQILLQKFDPNPSGGDAIT